MTNGSDELSYLDQLIENKILSASLVPHFTSSPKDGKGYPDTYMVIHRHARVIVFRVHL